MSDAEYDSLSNSNLSLHDGADILNLLFACDFFIFWMLNISQTASYEITLVRLSVCWSVCPSVRLSLSFLKIGSLVFSDIVEYDS